MITTRTNNGDFLIRDEYDTTRGRHYNVLCVHGIGHHDNNLSWQEGWAEAIGRSLLHWSPDAIVTCRFLLFDDLFSGEEITLVNTTEAVAKLLASGVFYGFKDLFTRRRGLFDLPERIRWTAGMVSQWTENDDLRAALRERLATSIEAFDPQVICAHSLGSLLSYDTFVQPKTKYSINNRTLITFGSQISNPFVRGVFGGRIVELNNATWYNLHNEEDDIFTTRIRLQSDRFEEVDTPFDISGYGDHDAINYLRHDNTLSRVWKPIASVADSPHIFEGAKTFQTLKQKYESPRRALLVGINDYPDPRMQLDGCVNDVFLIGSLLQEIGYDAEDIRIVLNQRATAEGIRDRLHWLLEGAKPGDQRVFYYSGHGAKIESYSVGEVVDRRDECLVPHDFDWTLKRAVVDDWLFDLYSQLDYDVSFSMLLDCCHSGGLPRAGVNKVRGINPPDDVRHRGLYWDAREQMWHRRPSEFAETDQAPRGCTIECPNPDLARHDLHRVKNQNELTTQETYLGEQANTRRLGRGTSALTLENQKFDQVRSALNHKGPYQPVVCHACGEREFSWEYLHGSVSYGAFTYALALAARAIGATSRPTFQSMIEDTAAKLKRLGYDQRPGIFGPATVRNSTLPWFQSREK